MKLLVVVAAAGPQYNNCRVSSFLSINDGAAWRLNETLFDQAFDEWNDDGTWTLKDGGALPGGSLQVTTFRRVANRVGTVAGVDIVVNWTYDGADKSDFFWSQGLYDDFKKDGTIGPLIYEMNPGTRITRPGLHRCGAAVRPATSRQLGRDHFFSISLQFNTT